MPLTSNLKFLATAAADTFVGGIDPASTQDSVSYINATDRIFIDLANTSFNTGWAAGDTYTGIDIFVGTRFGDGMSGNAAANTFYGGDGDDSLFGYDGADRLFGDNGADTLFGGTGNDQLTGGAGNDGLIGDAGADKLDGGAGIDEANYYSSASRIVVNLVNPLLNEGDAKGDRYISVENLFGGQGDDDMTGNAGNNAINGWDGNDWLYGLGGNDTLTGGTGDDRLEGGKGNDTLTGGSERDTFFFYLSDLANGSKDIITDMDFGPGGDKIVIQGVTANDITIVYSTADHPGCTLQINLGNGQKCEIATSTSLSYWPTNDWLVLI
jgi:Ca2+-binding RTX toxin-like protein